MDLLEDAKTDRVYLPAGNEYDAEYNNGVPLDEEIQNYINREFPSENKNCIYSIPKFFIQHGQEQASNAEKEVHTRLCGIQIRPEDNDGYWQVCFQGACYAGRSFRNDRKGKLMMREHDFVVFIKYKGKYVVILIEVKSICDDPSTGHIVSNTTSIKNNKRSGLHQLRDHVEILEISYNIPKNKLHCFLFWPYLTMWTKDPTGQKIRRWKDEADKHVFTDTINNQKLFDEWLFTFINDAQSMSKHNFDILFKRFVVMSCGVFVNEIHDGMLALLSQEQVSLLHSKFCKGGEPTIVHGAAGTGKTLLVIHKIQQLYNEGLLNENNRALYICYWPGIRMDFQIKVKKLGLLEYVDTARFFISQDTFALPRGKRYRHIFMDECEAICLAFNEKTIIHTFGTIQECRLTDYDEEYERCFTKLKFKKNIENNGLVNKTIRPKTYGELWYLVDINQAALFLPKYSPPMLKKPDIVLSKVIRNTATIYKVFSQFYKNPIPVMAQLADFYLNNVNVGHNIIGPPIYWANSDLIPDEGTTNFRTKTFQSLVRVVVDLCSTKGIKPNDLCVLPFIVTNTYLPDMINDEISSYFVTDGYRPMSIARVEEFLLDCDANNFLVPWVLRVKGLEFKVVIIAIEQGDFDFMDPEDRRKIYIMASRCTCLLIIVSSEKDKENIDIYKVIKNYPFGIAL